MNATCGLRNQREGFASVPRVEERVLRKRLAQPIDVRGGNVPGRERAVDPDEDRADAGHRRKSPLWPPRFSTRRMSPMTMRLSTALIMS